MTTRSNQSLNALKLFVKTEEHIEKENLLLKAKVELRKIEHPIAKLLIYTDKQSVLIAPFIRTFMALNEDTISSLDAYDVGQASQVFNSQLQLLKDRLLGIQKTELEIIGNNLFILTMESTTGLIDFIIDSYESFLSNCRETEQEYIQQQHTFSLPSFLKNEEEKQTIFNSLEKLDLEKYS